MAKAGSYRRSIRINGRVKSARFSRKADADLWYSKMQRQRELLRSGMEMPFDPIPIENFCADFISERTSNSTNDLDARRLALYVLPHLAGRELHSISRKEWKKVLNRLVTDHGLADKTHDNIRALIHRVYEAAKEAEPPRANQNPISTIPRRAKEDQEMDFFHTVEECEKYLRAAQEHSPEFGIFAMIALNTGAREGEIVALTWSDVSFTERTIRIWKTWSHSKRQVVKRTKSKYVRTIGINGPLLEALKAYRKATKYPGERDPIVCLPDGRPMPGDGALKRHEAVVEAAELKPIRAHDLRHTFATQYLSSGGNIYHLQKILGHRSIKTTEKYLHAIPKRIQQSADVFAVGAPALEGA